MSVKPLFFLGLSCIFAFGMATWAFTAGFGFFASLLIYSFAGSASLLLISAISFLPMRNDVSIELDDYAVAS